MKSTVYALEFTLVGAVVMIASTFITWFTLGDVPEMLSGIIGSTDYSGFDIAFGDSFKDFDGIAKLMPILVVIAGALAIVLTLIAFTKQKKIFWYCVMVMGILTVISALIFWTGSLTYDFTVLGVPASISIDMGDGIENGLYLTVVSGIITILGGLFGSATAHK